MGDTRLILYCDCEDSLAVLIMLFFEHADSWTKFQLFLFKMIL